MTDEHQVHRCEQCGEEFCPRCDLPRGADKIALMKPVLCGVCLDMSPSMSIRATIVHIQEMLDNGARRDGA